MSRRAILGVAALGVVVAVGGSCTSNALPGPRFNGITDLDDFVRVADAYHGPFTVELEMTDDSSRQTVRWDGQDLSVRQEPPSPIEEWRVIDGRTCFQLVDGNWVKEDTADPNEAVSLLDGISRTSVATDVDWYPEGLDDDIASFEVTDDGFTVSADDGDDEAVDRIEFELDAGRLVGASFSDEGNVVLTQRYTYEREPNIEMPEAEDGMDVTC